MYGFELELQRQRRQRLQAEADVQRFVDSGKTRNSAGLRRIIGQQLVRLGTLLQGETRPASPALHA